MFDPVSIQTRFSKFRWLIVFAAILGATLGYVAVTYEVGARKTYSSSTDFRVLPIRAELVFARESLGGSSAEQTRALIRTSKELIQSDGVLRSALDAVPEAKTLATDSASSGCSSSGFINQVCDMVGGGPEPATGDSGPSLRYVRDALRIDQIEGSFVLRLTVSLPDAKASADLANAIVQEYNSAVTEFDFAASSRIGDAFGERLAILETQYADLLDREIELREEIGAVTLESDMVRAQSELEVQSTELSQDKIDLVATEKRLAALEAAMPEPDSVSSGPAAPTTAESPFRVPVALGAPRLPTQAELLRTDIDALNVQIEERELILADLRAQIADAARKQIQLRPVVSQQATVLDGINELNRTLLDVATGNVANVARAVVLREGVPAREADPPSALQGAVIGGASGAVLVGSLVLLGALFAAAPAQAPATATVAAPAARSQASSAGNGSAKPVQKRPANGSGTPAKPVAENARSSTTTSRSVSRSKSKKNRK